jgi:hypothetical protein
MKRLQLVRETLLSLSPHQIARIWAGDDLISGGVSQCFYCAPPPPPPFHSQDCQPSIQTDNSCGTQCPTLTMATGSKVATVCLIDTNPNPTDCSQCV